MGEGAPLNLWASSLSWRWGRPGQPPAPKIWPVSCSLNISLPHLANENIRQGGVATATFLHPHPHPHLAPLFSELQRLDYSNTGSTRGTVNLVGGWPPRISIHNPHPPLPVVARLPLAPGHLGRRRQSRHCQCIREALLRQPTSRPGGEQEGGAWASRACPGWLAHI